MKDSQSAGDKSTSPKRLLVVTPFNKPGWRWHAEQFPADQYQFEFMNGNSYRLNVALWSWHAFKAVSRLKSFDGVITFHPFMTLWVSFWMYMRRIRRPHLAQVFNHGNQRFFKGFYLWAAKRALGMVDYFTVMSMDEREMFHERYGIAMEKLLFRHWAVAPPVVEEPLPDRLQKLQPYVCCIGRNNRDFETMFAAVRDLDLSLVVVSPKRALEGFDVPDNTVLMSDLSFQECMEIIKGSIANIIAILNNITGAGHMTIVSGMHIGKVQIVTEVDKARDYFVGGVHGFWARPRSAEDMREKIKRLMDDEALRKRFEANAWEFGQKWLSEEGAIKAARHDVQCWLAGEHPGVTPPGWDEERLRLDELARGVND